MGGGGGGLEGEGVTLGGGLIRIRGEGEGVTLGEVSFAFGVRERE